MTAEHEAAQRLAALKPSDIRAMDDESTMKLVADLARIGAGVSAGKVADDPQKVREVASKPKYWANVLITVNCILREEELRAASPRLVKRQPATQRKRLAAVADLGRCGITASECNEFLRSLPPMPLYGEPGCPFNPARFEIGGAA